MKLTTEERALWESRLIDEEGKSRIQRANLDVDEALAIFEPVPAAATYLLLLHCVSGETLVEILSKIDNRTRRRLLSSRHDAEFHEEFLATETMAICRITE